MSNDIYKYIEQLLHSKKYLKALDVLKEYYLAKIENESFKQVELANEIKGKRILINTTQDVKISKLFINPMIDYLISLPKMDFLNNYFYQCKYVNSEFEKLNSNLKIVLNKLKSGNHILALFKILSTFENKNHKILDVKKINPYKIYSQLGFDNDSLYESNIEALNLLIKDWYIMRKEGLFKEKWYKEKEVLNLKALSLNEEVMQNIHSLKFLYWLIDEINYHEMTIEQEELHIYFIYENIDEYIKVRLPGIRETYLMRKLNYGLINQHAKSKDINYEEIMKLKGNGEHFSLEFSIEIIYENMIKSIDVGKVEYAKLLNILFIHNYSELKYKNVNIEEVFMFYFCLRNMADIYYGATEYFIDKHNKSPKAPFLFVSIESLHYQLSNMLSKLFNRQIKINDIEDWVNFFTFGEDGIFDLYYKPLVRIGNHVALIPSIFLMNNVYKTFARHLQFLGVDLSDKGDKFEEIVKYLFKNSGFKVYQEKYKFNYIQLDNINISGDIDLIAILDSYLFIGEVKNHLDPLDIKDYRSGDKVINKASKQIQKILKYIEDKDEEFASRIGISLGELELLKIVPFIVLSGYYRSGENIDGIPITDYSSLDKFINDGELIIALDKEITGKVVIRENALSGEIFMNHLTSPYFYGINGCYAPYLYLVNSMNINEHQVYALPRLEPFNTETYKYIDLYPNEEKIKSFYKERLPKN